MAHDLPTHIDNFAASTNGRLGCAEAIVLQRTILPFFLPHRAQAAAQKAIAAMRGGSSRSVKARLGLLASRFGASHPLKACPQCMAVDLVEADVAYWHRDHQWPGAWICAHHGELLMHGLAKVNGSGRYDWWLPADLTFAQCIPAADEGATRPHLEKLVGCVCGLGRLSQGTFLDPIALRRTYRARLSELDLVIPAGRLRLADFGNFMRRVCEPLSSVFGLGILNGGEVPIVSQFSRLAYKRRGVAHPLKHLIMVTALFDSWEHFLCSYEVHRHEPQAIEKVNDPGVAEASVSHIGPEVVLELIDSGASASSAAKLCGITVATAMAWGALGGRSPRRRPKKLTEGLRELVIRRLREGTPKVEVAELVHVSVQTITSLLRTEPGLHEAWKNAAFCRVQREARRKWARAIHGTRLSTVSDLRSRHPAEYAWLYRNDRAWLTSSSQHLPDRPLSNHSKSDWKGRDDRLAQAVLVICRQHVEQHNSDRLTLSELCNQIPELKGRLSKMDHLRRTQDAVSHALGRRKRRAKGMGQSTSS